jgi:molecular chaperone Hsp33
MALGVRIDKDLTCLSAGGIVIQALPFASESSLIKAEKLMQEFKNVSLLLEEKGVEKILEEYFGVTDFVEETPDYKCLCSRNYLRKVISTLGQKEFDQIIAEQGKVSVRCEFCGRNYHFTKEDGEKIFGRK